MLENPDNDRPGADEGGLAGGDAEALDCQTPAESPAEEIPAGDPFDGGNPSLGTSAADNVAADDAAADHRTDDVPTADIPAGDIPTGRVPHEAAAAPVPEQTGDEAPSDDWPHDPADEIEEAYQKALAAIDDVSWGAGAAAELADALASGDEIGAPAAEVAGNDTGSSSAAAAEAVQSPIEPASTEVDRGQATPPGLRLARGTEPVPPAEPAEASQVTPSQVIEAALFVGGGPLTAKKLCTMLRGGVELEAVESMIDELNERYSFEARPYEIRLGDGGYRLELRPEFERLRQRVYGAGPREVKLSQEVLEILALVAYRQPISPEEVEAHGKQNAGGPLRQLLRRDLVALQRGEGGRKDVRYVTTPRFLQVFGLSSLDELPEPEDLARK